MELRVAGGFRGLKRGNPASIGGLEDLGRADLLLGLCAIGVPCGDVARQALAASEVSPAIDTAELNVRALLAKVAEGELDGAIVYVTDVVASDAVEAISIPAAQNVMTPYLIAQLTGGSSTYAESFVAFVVSGPGQDILAEHGFLPV